MDRLTAVLSGLWWMVRHVRAICRLSVSQREAASGILARAGEPGFTDDIAAHARVYAGLPTLERAVVTKVARTVSDPAFLAAREAVKTTAITLGLNRPTTWDELANTVKSQPVWAENMWRHVHALKLLHKRTSATRQLSNPDLNLLTELGYVSFALKPRD